jgi:hypothetical protein
MSGLVSGITKIFTSLGTGAATLGSAVRGVGASLFTASAATGSSMASGGLSNLFGGTLGSMISGALKTGLTGGLIGAGVGALTGDWKKGALYGGLGGAAVGAAGGLMSGNLLAPAAAGAGVDTITTGSTSPVVAANTPTGAVPNYGGPGEGASRFGGSGLGTPLAAATPTSAVQTPQTSGGGFGNLFGGDSSILGNVLKGGAEAYSAYEDRQANADLQKEQLDYLREKQDKITAGYAVPASALVGGRTPGQWYYDGQDGQVKQA